MGVALSEDFTKYHGRREKVAKISVTGGRSVTLGLSDTLRCAKDRDAAKRTVANVADGALRGPDLDEAAAQLHQHCRVLSGIHEDPTTRRG
jgi:hypothetical protein